MVSLFTCIPTGLAIQVARRRLLNGPSLPERTSRSVNDIVDLLALCLKATFLDFRGKVYKQVHGTAMGSSVSVVVANLVMEDIEERALATFHSSPRFWKRYVDDTCAALPRSLVDQFHKHLNSLEPCIQKDSGAIGHKGCVSPTEHPPQSTCSSKGPSADGPAQGSCLPDTVWWMPQSVCRTDCKDPEAPIDRASPCPPHR